METLRRSFLSPVFFTVVLVVSGPVAAAGSTPGLPDSIAQWETTNGLCCVLGWDDGVIPLALVRSKQFLVHVLEASPSAVQAARAMAAREGTGINRIVIEGNAGKRLPYADHIVDLVVTSAARGPAQEELLRVLRPGGRAFIEANGRWESISAPEPDGVDDWSHWEHGPDNNPVSRDEVIKAPYVTQWLGLPYYIAMPAITTAAGGRTFTAMGHIAHHRREEPWLNTLLARNGYNGAELWTRRLPDGYLVHRSAFIATDDAFYMIQEDGHGLLVLAPETGLEADRIAIPEATGEWKWIAMDGNTLFVLSGSQRDPNQLTIVRSERPAWSWGELSSGYYVEPIPWGFGTRITAYDMQQRAVRWTHDEDTPIDSRGMAVGGDRVYLYCPQKHVACIEAANGQAVWANEDPELRRLIEEPGQGLTSTPGFKTTCLCVCTPQAVIYQGQARMNVVALAPEDGRLLWTHRKTSNNPNAIYLDGNVYIGVGADGQTIAADPLTGAETGALGFTKRSCARLTATTDSLFCRGWPEGLTRYDLNSKTISFNGAVRPACNDGVIGANGLLYIGPWLCDCNLSLMGTLALCSDRDTAAPAPDRASQLERSTQAISVHEEDATDEDWPAYRGGAAHAGATRAAIPDGVAALWTFRPERSFHPVAATAACGQVFVTGNDGIVRALDAATGMDRWRFATAGPIAQPPTYWNGRVFVGSGDGFIYALDAATGGLLWRFRAAPIERRIMVYGALCSTWPVNTGVVLEKGIAYAAAGIIDYDGTYVYALDAVSGEAKWCNHTSGHLDKSLRKGVSAQGNMTVADGRLWLAGGNVISPAAYDIETGAYQGPGPGDGSPAANRGDEVGVLGEDRLVFGGRLRYSAPDNIVSPARFDIGAAAKHGERVQGKPFCLARVVPVWDAESFVYVPERGAFPECCTIEDVESYLDGGRDWDRPKPLWRAALPEGSDCVALALARNAVAVAFARPRQRALDLSWQVLVLDRRTGEKRSSHDIPGEVLLNGLSIDRRGRILVTLTDGRLVALCGGDVIQEYARTLGREAAQPGQAQAEAIRRLRETFRNTSDANARLVLSKALQDAGHRVDEPALRRGCITRWHMLGPVPWDDVNPIDKAFAGEPAAKVRERVRLGGETLEWREFVTDDENGMVDLARYFGALEHRAAYAWAEVRLPEARTLELRIGSNDGFVCWFNGREAARFEGGRAWGPDQNRCNVQAQKGINTILMKVTQMGGAWAFSARLLDVSGNAIDLMRDAE